MKNELGAVAAGSAAGEKVSVAAPITVGGGVSALTVCGYPLPDLVQIATGVYLLISICRLCWQWRREILEARKEAMP